MQNKKKMRILSSICAAMLTTLSISGTALAQVSEKDYSLNFGLVTFSGATDVKGGKVTYTVSDAMQSFYDVGELWSDDNGEFCIDFKLKESGKYIIKIKDSSGDVLEKEIDYINAKDREEHLINELSTGTETQVEAALDELNFSFEEVLWQDVEDEELKEWVVEVIKEHQPYESLDEAGDEFITQNILYKINTSKVTKIVSEIKEYAQALGIEDNSEVSSFTKNATDAKKRELVSTLSDSPAKTVSDLTEAIEQANDVKESSENSGGGGGGGSRPSGNKTGAASVGNVTSIGTVTNKPSREETVKTEFSDLADFSWAKEAVNALAAQGIVSGDGNGNFRPGVNVTREEFVKMVVEAFDIPNEAKACHFIDVFESDWFYYYVASANEAGIVNGMSADFFGVHKNITRQDAAAILKRAADYAGIELNAVRGYEQFTDDFAISDYAKDAVEALYQNGVINGVGDGSFKPQNTCTRAEAAKMIYGIIF